MKEQHIPLFLYTNFKLAAEKHSQVEILFDKKLPAFPELGTKTDYKNCFKAIENFASKLANYQIQSGDFVIIYKSSGFDSYLIATALSGLGAVPVMVSWHLSASIIDQLSERLDFPIIIFDSITKPNINLLDKAKQSKVISIEDIMSKPADQEVKGEITDPNQMCYITHTSGTTGVPKLIVHSPNSMGWRTLYHRRFIKFVDDKTKPIAFHISPVHSRYNIGVSSLIPLGFPMLIINSIDEQELITAIEKYKPYAFETHPNNFVSLASYVKNKPESFSSIKYYHTTFDAINKGTLQTFLNSSSYENPIFLQIYGQSECGPMLMKIHNKRTIKHWDSRNMGKGCRNLTYAIIVDANGTQFAPLQHGKILMFSKGIALTYYKEEARFNDTMHGKFRDSGDFGFQDNLGNTYLLDRQVDLINSVDSTLQIEDKLLDSNPNLIEVVIVRNKQDKAQPVIALARNKTMDYQQWEQTSKSFPFLLEPIIMDYNEIPRTATMKVKRNELEKIIQQK